MLQSLTQIRKSQQHLTFKKIVKTNFINDDKLRNWLWNNFEKQYFMFVYL